MVSLKLLLYLAVGTAVMYIPVLILTLRYSQKVLKSVPLTLLLTVSGTLGTYLMFYLESGYIGGTSFYGAVFLVPLLFVPVAWLLRMPYGYALDLCAAGECAMLAVMKVQCLLSGCCRGAVLYVTEAGAPVRFPSQIAELANALLLLVILLCLSRKETNRGKLYPMYMLLYGLTRFVLNLFREARTPFALGLPAGNFWSVWSVLIGAAMLFVLSRKKKQR